MRAESVPVPELPEGVVPLPSESDSHFQELLKAAETYRGLQALRPVPVGTLEEPELRKKMAQSMAEDLSPEELEAIERAAKAFGLIPESLDLSSYLPDLLTSQVAGFYDPVRDYMALVSRGTSQGPGEEGEAEDAVIVHELVHALQDQHFDLRQLEKLDPASDAATAFAALTEGDATLAMISFLAGANVEEVSGIGEAMKSLLEAPELMSAASEISGGADLTTAPAWIRDSLLFPYAGGLAFCMEVRRVGGQKLVDYAFSTDPPRSSEQILHPEKWHAKRDDPVLLRWPDLSAALPGWRKVAEGELGEAGIQTLLREIPGNRDQAAAAAAGWGGDRFALYEKDGRRVLVWWTEWDSEAEAREFRSAARRLRPGWRLETLSNRRVLVMRGDLGKGGRAAVRARLAAAEAVPPANPAIDPKALEAAPAAQKPSGSGKLPAELPTLGWSGRPDGELLAHERGKSRDVGTPGAARGRAPQRSARAPAGSERRPVGPGG